MVLLFRSITKFPSVDCIVPAVTVPRFAKIAPKLAACNLPAVMLPASMSLVIMVLAKNVLALADVMLSIAPILPSVTPPALVTLAVPPLPKVTPVIAEIEASPLVAVTAVPLNVIPSNAVTFVTPPEVGVMVVPFICTSCIGAAAAAPVASTKPDVLLSKLPKASALGVLTRPVLLFGRQSLALPCNLSCASNSGNLCHWLSLHQLCLARGLVCLPR